MRLCDRDIKAYLDDGKISIEPRPSDDCISGLTIDVSLGNNFRVFNDHGAPFIDLSGKKEDVATQLEKVMSDEIIVTEEEAFFFIRGSLH